MAVTASFTRQTLRQTDAQYVGKGLHTCLVNLQLVIRYYLKRFRTCSSISASWSIDG